SGTGDPTPTSQRGQLFRYSYDAATDTYSPDAGFPVEVTGGQAEALTLAMDSTGRLWVTYVESQQVMVNTSSCSPTCNDASWGSPFVLPTPNAANLTDDDLSAVVAFEGKIGILFSNQTLMDMFFAVHPDAQAPDAGWTQVAAYTPSADDHMSFKVLSGDGAGKVLAAIKTSQNSALIILLVCKTGSCDQANDWQSYTAYDNSFSSTRPNLLVDVDNRQLYIATRNKVSTDDGIYLKQTSLDSPSFTLSEIGTQLIGTTAIDSVNDPTTWKGNLTNATGLVVLASDAPAQTYFHGSIAFSGPAISSFAPASGPVGTEVTITGSGFTGATQLTFDGTPASYSVTSDAQIQATVPLGATTGSIRVTTPAGTATSASDFVVTSGFTLTVNVVGAGSVALGPSSGSYPPGTIVTLTATPSAGSSFVGWSGDLTGSANPTTLTMNANKVVTATFSHFVLTVTEVGSGSVAVAPPGSVHPAGTVVTFTALPDPGFGFAGWSGDLGGSANPASLSMDADRSVTASFGPPNAGEVAFATVATGGATNASSVSTSGSIPAAAGEVYLATVSTKNYVNTTAVSGLGLGWTELADQCGGRGQTGVSLWWSQGAPSGSTPVTATFASSVGAAGIAVARYSGTPLVDPLGATPNVVSANTKGVAGTCSGGTDTASYSVPFTTKTPDALVFGAAALRQHAHTPGAGWTERAEITAGSGGSAAGVAVEDQSFAAPGSVAVAGSFGSTVDWAVAAVEVHASQLALPQVASFSPAGGPVGTQVTILGSGFTGTTVVAFDGTPAASFVVDSDSQIRTLVPSGATSGPILVVNPAGAAESPSSFFVGDAPVVGSFDPMFGSVGTEVTITGSDFTGATGVTFNGTPAASVFVDSDVQVRAAVPPGATTGPIAVTNPAGTGTSTASFFVGDVPVVSAFAPTFGPVGTEVVITGSGFTDVSTVAFNGTAAAIVFVDTPSQIRATVPASATTGPIAVTNPAGTGTSAASFFVGDVPVVGAFAPTFGPLGTEVTVAGSDFTEATSVAFNGTVASSVFVDSDVQMRATVPPGATTGPIAVTNPAGTGMSTANFGVLPAVASFAPGAGPVGTEVTILGSGFTGANGVTFNGTAATGVIIDSDVQIRATVSLGATTGPISVTNPAGTGTSAASFFVGSTPVVSSFAPTFGPVGTAVVITGSGFTDASDVTFNGTLAVSPLVVSDTEIQATVPSGATTGPISVTNPVGTGTSAASFLVGSTPVVSSFAPTFGPVGTAVVITGSGFAESSAVAFNGTLAVSPLVVSDTEIQATVPSGATTGPISVTNPVGTGTSAGSFFVGAVPVVSSFAPTFGPVGTAVVIMGSGFADASAVAFNGTLAVNPLVVSDTEIQATVPSGATTGPISVTNPVGTGTSAASFFVGSAPVVSSFAPTFGPVGTAVVIDGSGFTDASAVAFNGTLAVNPLVVSDTEIQAT
ncbi:MAG: hypothetical protein L0206_18285, partial [Actinobacteria bacterium]|nr:hypothetical protein [Actinomycetota bacterium]